MVLRKKVEAKQSKMTRTCLVGTVTALVLLLGLDTVEGHGQLTQPKSRNQLARDKNEEFCPHCLNGGTVGTVKANDPDGEWQYIETVESSARHGFCGDAANGDQVYLESGAIQSEWIAGSEVSLQVWIDTHHNGYFSFGLCDISNGQTPTQDCLVPMRRSENDPSESPYDANYPERYYLPPKCSSEFDANGKGFVTMKYMVPEDMVCEKCVLQWWWVTANTCAGPGYDLVNFPDTYGDCSGDGGSVGWLPRTRSDGLVATCDKTGGYPEEFWNCADVRILPSASGSSGPTSLSTTDAPTEPEPTSSPTAASIGGGGGDCEDDVGSVDSTNFAKSHGKLKLGGADEIQLVDAFGDAIQLIGASSHGLHWFPQCYTKDSLQYLVQNWGITVFRAAMYIGEGGYASDDSVAEKLHQVVQWCEELGIYVIIDWHILSPGDPNAWLELASSFWRQTAERYKDASHVIYEIANEPNNVNWATVKSYHDTIIPIIRAIDEETIIVAGTTTWSQDVHLAAQNPIADPHNVMYAFHFYAGTHESLYSRIEYYSTRIPIFVTEWGASEASGNGETRLDIAEKFLALFHGDVNGVKLSWAKWNYADKDESSSMLQPSKCSSKEWDATTCSGTWLKNYIKTHSEANLLIVTSTSTKTPTNSDSVEGPKTNQPTLSTTLHPTVAVSEEQEPDLEVTTDTPTPLPTSSPQAQSQPQPQGEQKCSHIFDQCGGVNWKGPKCCYGNSACVKKSKWYSQCKYADLGQNTCSQLHEQCGGKNWKGPTCCYGNARCVKNGDYYSACQL